MRPFEPEISSLDLPGTGGAIGPEPEDFRVDELPLYEASGEGEHLYVLVRKRLCTTPAMVREIARAAAVDERDLGYAGLKDKFAVTTQWLSLPNKALDPGSWRLPEAITLERVTRHKNKLRTGHLLANRFRIRLEGCDPEAPARGSAIRERLLARGLVNYFGAQRFGEGGENLARALDWLRRGGDPRRLNRFLAKLYPSVIQSEIFNRYAARRLELGAERLITGEVVRLEGAGATFTVEDAEREGPRLLAGDLHLTGPIVGPRGRQAAGAALELEQDVVRELELTSDDLRALARAAPGSRRDLLLRVTDLAISEAEPGERPGLVLGFTLPAGSYATQLIREFTRSPFFAEAARE